MRVHPMKNEIEMRGTIEMQSAGPVRQEVIQKIRQEHVRRNLRALRIVLTFAFAGLVAGCNVGPPYHKPSATTPPAYKELTPEDSTIPGIWKQAQPSDAAIRGKWWELYNDPELNSLEDKVDTSNQTVAAAYANFLAARAIVKEARAQYFPTLSVAPGLTVGRPSANASGSTSSGFVASKTTGTETEYSLPFDASWTPDLFGRVRNTVRAAQSGAQADAADVENLRLTAHAEVAVDYFELRGQDSLVQLFDNTVKAYKESLRLNQVLYNTGIENDEAVAQAQTQLDTAEAQATNLGILRAQYEHAIAVLMGQPASTVSVPVATLKQAPPPIPVGVPSQLLERRPDIAQNERLVAQANAQIGVGRAAYFPTLSITAQAGFQSSSITNLLAWPSRAWSVGPTISETIFDGGLRRATVQQYVAQYQETVANYRQTVLTAFQQVEDNLSSLRILSQEVVQQDDAVAASQNYLDVATARYKLGLDPYLDVITAQTALFTNQQTAVDLREQAMNANVQLIEALGGGWDTSRLPSPNSSTIQNPPQLEPAPTRKQTQTQTPSAEPPPAQTPSDQQAPSEQPSTQQPSSQQPPAKTAPDETQPVQQLPAEQPPPVQPPAQTPPPQPPPAQPPAEQPQTQPPTVP
jgi:NodT family efflux transporter outer membrane factor (OMF) lipoprotein